MVSNAAAIVVETVKLRLSAIRTVPPFVSRAGAIDPSEKVNGCGGAPLLLTTARSAPPTPGRSEEHTAEIQSHFKLGFPLLLDKKNMKYVCPHEPAHRRCEPLKS